MRTDRGVASRITSTADGIIKHIRAAAEERPGGRARGTQVFRKLIFSCLQLVRAEARAQGVGGNN